MQVDKVDCLRKKILSTIYPSIPWYLFEEVEHFLWYVQYHKLNNILLHIDAMNEYLAHLDSENTENMKQLVDQTDFWLEDKNCPVSTYDLLYFVSDIGLQSIKIDKLNMFLSLEESSIQKLSMVMYRTKWHFLLMASEFCHASETRISLRRHILHY